MLSRPDVYPPNQLTMTCLGYLKEFSNARNNNVGWGAPEGAAVVLGISPPAVLTFILISFTLAFVPIIYGLRKLPGDMVVGACDSLVLSAACHPYVPSSAPQASPHAHINNQEGKLSHVTLKVFAKSDPTEMGQVNEQLALRKLSRGKLRWGVVPVPPELAKMASTEQYMMHLSFSGVEEYVSNPMIDFLYA